MKETGGKRLQTAGKMEETNGKKHQTGKKFPEKSLPMQEKSKETRLPRLLFPYTGGTREILPVWHDNCFMFSDLQITRY